jgi:hypothetical protein
VATNRTQKQWVVISAVLSISTDLGQSEPAANLLLQKTFQYSIAAGDSLLLTGPSKEHRAMFAKEMFAKEAYKFMSMDMYVVETQKTRAGSDSEGASTRPYRFGEFDLLAVSMHPSTNVWDRFMYTVADRLLPNPKKKTDILKFQPVAITPNNDWTDDFHIAVTWLRSGINKTIQY